MLGHYLSKFPEGYTPSKQQVDLIKNIEEAFNNGYKFIICSAPTGSGKSFISKTLANVSKESSDGFKELVSSYAAFKIDQTGTFLNEDECKDESPSGTFALTITKTLQDQYKDLFDDTILLKGKSKYGCRVRISCNT